MLEALPLSKVCTKCQGDLPLDSFGLCKRGKFGRKSECKGCLAKKEEARRAKDPGAYREYKRRWWAEHPGTPEQKKKSALKARTWYSRNKTRRAVTFKAWVASNKEAYREIQRRYLVKNPVHIRRAAHWNAVERTLTEVEWAETLAYFNHACAYCLRSDVKLTMDHLVPVSKGGPHTQDNVVPACKSCNSRKGARPLFLMLGQQIQTHTEMRETGHA